MAACWELFSLLRVGRAPILGIACGVILAGTGLFMRSAPEVRADLWLASGLLLQAVGVFALSQRRSPPTGFPPAAALLGWLWILSPLCAASLLHLAGVRGAEGWHVGPTWLLLLPVWLGDSAALLVGRRWGRRKLAPSLSPGKTWEGAAANLAATAAGGILAAWLAALPLAVGILSGLCCGVFGQAGDLFESWIKRRANTKDSGALLPGHGGVLDRIDSLLFSAWPVVGVLWAWGLLGG